MSLFAKLLALLRVSLPIPSFRDVAAVTAWLQGMAAAEADLIVMLANQFAATGQIQIELPGGRTIFLSPTPAVPGLMISTDALASDPIPLLASALASEAGEPEANGKWLEFLKKWVPIILQILPFFLEPAPKPAP